MERAISEKVQRLTRILLEEADRFPRISVGQYSSGRYGYDWKVYLDEERYLGTISFTTEVPLRGRTPGSIPARAESARSQSGGVPGSGTDCRPPVAQFSGSNQAARFEDHLRRGHRKSIFVRNSSVFHFGSHADT